MNVRVKLFGGLRLNNEKEKDIDMAEGSRIIEIVEKLNIAEEDISLIMINGKREKINSPLSSGDIVSIFPPMGGG